MTTRLSITIEVDVPLPPGVDALEVARFLQRGIRGRRRESEYIRSFEAEMVAHGVGLLALDALRGVTAVAACHTHRGEFTAEERKAFEETDASCARLDDARVTVVPGDQP
jgi:hypothetical protein